MKRSMRLILLLLALVMVFSLAACSKSGEGEADAKEAEKAVEPEEPKLVVISNDRVLFDDHNGYDALIVDVTVTNLGEEELPIEELFRFNVYQMVDGEKDYLNYTFAKDENGDEYDTMDRSKVLAPGETYSFTYIQEGSVGIFYLDGLASLTVRLYGVSGKSIQLFAENNAVQFSSLREYTR